MNLTSIYSKTSKGSRLRSTFFGGLSSPLKKVLSLVDGKSNVKQILAKLNEVSEQKLTLDLSQLELDGYIKQVSLTVSDEWLRVSVFSPIVVEEFSCIEEIEAKAERDLQLEAEQKERESIEYELQAREVVEKIRAKEKAKADEKNRLEAEARHTTIVSVFNTLKEAEQNRIIIDTEDKAGSEVVLRIEAEKISLEQVGTSIKLEAEALVKAETEDKIEKEHIALEQVVFRKNAEAEALANGREIARIEAEHKAKQQVELRQNAEVKARQALQKVRAKEQAAEQEARKKYDQITLLKAEEKKRNEAAYIAQQEANVHYKIETAASDGEAKFRIKTETDEKVKTEELKYIEIESNVREAEVIQKILETQARPRLAEEVSLEENRIAKKVQKNAIATNNKIRKESNKHVIVEVQRSEVAVLNDNPKKYKSTKISPRQLTLGKLIPIAMKSVLIYLPLFSLLLLSLLNVINLSFLISPIQKLASESVGKSVTINEVHVSLWPELHLTLNDVSVRDNSGFKNEGLNIASVYISPAISSLFENVKVVDSIKLSGINLNNIVARKVMELVNSSSKAEHLKIKRINFNQVNIKILDLSFEPFEGDVVLDESGGIRSININNSDHGLSISMSPNADDYIFFLTATKWLLPFNPKILFEELNARGKINGDQINFSQIDGNIYGGNLNASAILNWSKQWVVAGSFSLSQASTSQLLKAFSSDGDIDGKLKLVGNFAGTSDIVANLARKSEVNAGFELRNGKINGIKLERAVVSSGDKSLTGYATEFDKLTGDLKYKEGGFKYLKLLLEAPQLQAQGNLEIKPNQDISGNINASLATQSRRLDAKFELMGKVNNVKQR